MTALLAAALFCLAGGSSAQAAGGTAMGWGYNASGAVGNGAVGEDVRTPTPLLGVGDVTEIAAGDEFGLALRSDGTVLSWGYNYSGELGNGNRDLDPVPKPVPGLTNARSVAAGGSHSLVLLADGTLLTWGGNDSGQLGIGSSAGPELCSTNQCSQRPVAVPGIVNAIAIAAGVDNSYALLADGSVLAWGDDGGGATGNGTGTDNPCSCVPSPTLVPGVQRAVAITGGQYTAAAVLPDGSVRAWGRNVIGELGTGATTPPAGCFCLGPVSPAGLSNVRQLSFGGAHALALLSSGLAQAWGYNPEGQLGIGFESDEACFCVPTPTTIGGLSDIRKVDAGDEHSVALLSNGAVMSWGDDDYGQLGDDDVQADRPSPGPVPGVTGASDVTATDSNTYAIVGPSQTLSIAFAGDETGTVGGSGILCSAQCSQIFAQGQVKALRADPSSPGRFAGFTGAGCSGTGPCFARLDSDQTVTATFGKPNGTKITKLKLKGKKKKNAKLFFATPGVVTGFQCLLVKPKPKKKAGAKKSAKKKKPKYSSCASGKTYKKLKPGKYTFKVRALNSLGTEAKPAKRTFKVRAAKKR